MNLKILSIFFIVIISVVALNVAAQIEEMHTTSAPTGLIANIVIFIVGSICIFFSFKTANIFTKELGHGMKIIAFGLILFVVNAVLKVIHFSQLLTGQEPKFLFLHNEAIHSTISAIGFLILIVGFHQIYKLAIEFIASKSTSKKEKQVRL